VIIPIKVQALVATVLGAVRVLFELLAEGGSSSLVDGGGLNRNEALLFRLKVLLVESVVV
jgi:hypothetical protein